jgi:fumarate reductase subunit D
MKAHRKQPLYLAFMLHRLSGLGLALFLPFHFSELPLVKFAEFGLVFLLALHFFGGLRLLALENLPWSNRQKNYAAVALAAAFFVACGYLLRAI